MKSAEQILEAVKEYRELSKATVPGLMACYYSELGDLLEWALDVDCCVRPGTEDVRKLKELMFSSLTKE